MNISVSVPINASREAIWAVITDFDNVADNISGITRAEVLERPASGLVGLRWREARVMFGKKESTEEMEITEAVENQYYKTRAESHGCIYTSTVRISEVDSGCSLSMEFGGQAQSFIAKMMSTLMGWMMKGAVRKMIQKDLEDVKSVVEGKGTGQSPS